jgi:hypothetical protein
MLTYRAKEMKAYSFIIVFVSLAYSGPLLADLIDKGSANFVNRNSDANCESREINTGCIRAAEDLSAIGRVGPYLVIGGDEAVGPDKNLNIIQFLSKQEDGQYVVGEDILLPDVDKNDGGELDIEGIAVDGNFIYVIGSHSVKRNKTSSNKSYKKNRKTFNQGKIEEEPSRDWLHRIEVNQQVQPVEKKSISLRDVISKNKALKAFSEIPSKENGVDIEGLAVDDGWLYAGFRGPVFRDNYVPVLKFKFGKLNKSTDLLLVKLDGGGIRDMARVEDGFLLVSGPVGDAPGPYQVYHWNGLDMVPGKDRADTKGYIKKLGNIDGSKGKAEGILPLELERSADDDCQYKFMIIFDGVVNGNPKIYCSSKD